MERAKQLLFQITNNTDLPQRERDAQAAEMVAGLLALFREGYAKAEQAGTGTPAAGTVATLPREYWADKEMFNEAFNVLARWACVGGGAAAACGGRGHSGRVWTGLLLRAAG